MELILPWQPVLIPIFPQFQTDTLTFTCKTRTRDIRVYCPSLVGMGQQIYFPQEDKGADEKVKMSNFQTSRHKPDQIKRLWLGE